jgi:hypothetical protein
MGHWNQWYRLDEDHNPVAISFEQVLAGKGPSHDRVGSDHVENVHVSTVFLGLNHRYCGGGPPILFETMIFGGEHDQYQERYCTWAAAEEGHKRAVKMATEGSKLMPARDED